MVARLRETRSKIAEFLTRKPQLKDPEFDEWETSVRTFLTEVFGASGYLLRYPSAGHSTNQPLCRRTLRVAR